VLVYMCTRAHARARAVGGGGGHLSRFAASRRTRDHSDLVLVYGIHDLLSLQPRWKELSLFEHLAIPEDGHMPCV
jgi:hypothetical protein